MASKPRHKNFYELSLLSTKLYFPTATKSADAFPWATLLQYV